MFNKIFKSQLIGKMCLLVAMSLVSLVCLATNYDVGQGYYATIQGAINAAFSDNYTTDYINIICHDVFYEENIAIDCNDIMNFPELRLVTSEENDNCTISGIGGNTIYIVGKQISILISGFQITNSSTENTSGIKIDRAPSLSSPVSVEDCTILNNDSGISCETSNVSVNGCKIRENCIGINFLNINGGDDFDYISTVNYSEISYNDLGLTGCYASSLEYIVYISNCTIFNNSTQSIDIDGPNLVSNSIVSPQYDSASSDFIYSNTISILEEGPGNINVDPNFCLQDDYKYYLLEGSPCIDAGDSSMDDDDGTIRDMGCYPSTTDIKPLKGDASRHLWNWVSFPRVPRPNNDPNINELYNASSLLSEMIPFPDEMTLRFGKLDVLTYEANEWTPPTYNIQSDLGYKLAPEENGALILPELGTRLSATHTKNITVGANWVGYWLPKTQKFLDALPQDQLDKIKCIQAEDWFVIKKNGEWSGMTNDPNAGTFVYGKSYVITAIQDFTLQWVTSIPISIRFKKPETEIYTANEKADYEMIEIESIEGGEEALEVALYQGEECVGASKIEEYPVYMMAYTDAANRTNELSFEVSYGRGEGKKIQSIQIYNPKTDTFEAGTMHPWQREFTIIRLGASDEGESAPENIAKLSMSNYPNPFNPTTIISFNLPQDEEVSLTIYNTKGQKVKTIAQGNFKAGKQNITWNGTDTNDNPVSSGIYMYRLQTSEKTLSKKMILLK